jgi:four helix bundle protein
MPFKFEKLEVWRLALDYVDAAYELAAGLPRSEDYNLKAQLTRAATSVALNIAEGSTGQTNAEQARFIGLATRSLIETVACQHLIVRRKLITDREKIQALYKQADHLAVKLQAMRRTIAPEENWLREADSSYSVEGPNTNDADSRPASILDE